MKFEYLISLGLLLGLSCGQGDAPMFAQQFANRHYPEHRAVECVDGINVDSDSNGYISCTVFLHNDTIPIECATNYAGCRQGCRIATGK
jgi:hypothetical protein